MIDQLLTVWQTIKPPLAIFFKYWWIYTPVVMFFGVIELYRNFTKARYLAGIKWVLLEITPPPDVQKSPKIAENFFSGLHGIYGKALPFKKQFFEGKVPDWFSLEIVGSQGDIRFYIRTPEALRNVIEAQLFAQYPDAQITEAQDYVENLPRSLPDQDHDLFGGDLIFTREDAYPIKTYPFFEEDKGKDEFVRTDPLSPLAELMSGLLPGEHLWLQLLVRPTGGDWVKKAQGVVDKMVGKKPKVEKGLITVGLEIVESIFQEIFRTSSGEAAPKRDDKEFSLMKLTPGQKFVLEQIENKMAKLGFKCDYRFMYIAKKDVFNRARIANLIGMFKQLYANNMNMFRPNGKTITVADGWFPWLFPSNNGFFKAQQEYKRKYKIYKKYRNRTFMKQVIILNTEELATLFHLPGINVKAPALPRVDSKTGTPPINLPTR